MKIVITIFALTNIAFAMNFDAENIEKISLMKDKKTYEVVIKNKAAFYKANEKLLACLQKGMKEKVELEIDPSKLTINKCK